jgi:hypothetical protein
MRLLPRAGTCDFLARHTGSKHFFKGMSTVFGLRTVENRFESAFGAAYSAFQNLCLGAQNWEGGHFRASGENTHETVDKNSR